MTRHYRGRIYGYYAYRRGKLGSCSDQVIAHCKGIMTIAAIIDTEKPEMPWGHTRKEAADELESTEETAGLLLEQKEKDE